MDIYNLGKVNSTIDGVIGPLRHGFNIIGVHGRPLVTFSFDTQEEAETAHKAMRDVVASAKLIKPHVVPRRYGSALFPWYDLRLICNRSLFVQAASQPIASGWRNWWLCRENELVQFVMIRMETSQ